MRGTLAQEAREAMNDAREAHKGVVAAQPSDEEKIRAYQASTEAIMEAASARKDHVLLEYANFALLRAVGAMLVDQGIDIKFDFEKCALTARWG
jgi:hypothetical protein